MNEPTLIRGCHSAACLDNYVVIIGGSQPSRIDKIPLPTDVIWMYNLYTEVWRKHIIPKHVIEENGSPDQFYGGIAVNVSGTIYTFGGYGMDGNHRNALWALSKTKTESLIWSFITFQHEKESPSPRLGHTGWEYAGKLWIFGGSGPSPENYLHDYGDIAFLTYGCPRNNQLLCYDPSTQKWTNPRYFGSFPSPRSGHVSAIIKDKVWVLGGFDQSFDSLSELNMPCLTWTQIQIDYLREITWDDCTLTALSDDQLVLYFGFNSYQVRTQAQFNDTWIMDVASYSWTQCTSRQDHSRRYHTGSTGLNNSVIIIGGYMDVYETYESYDNVFHVMFEAKSLQQLAMLIIYKHQDELNWNYLPKKLISLLGLSTEEKD